MPASETLPVDVVRPVLAAVRSTHRFHSARRIEPLSVHPDVPLVTCEQCYDLLVDASLHAVVVAGDRLTSADNPGGYIRTCADNYLMDRGRAESVQLGGVAKPERPDGVVGAVRRVLADGDVTGWRPMLLTLMLRDASTGRPLPSTTWAYERFAAAKAAHTGRTDLLALGREVRRDVADVLRTAVRVAGRAWVDAYVDAPQRARAAAHNALPIGEPRVGGGPVVDLPDDRDAEGRAHDLRGGFWRHLVEVEPVEAVRRAAEELAEGVPVDVPARLNRAVAITYLTELVLLCTSGPVNGTDVREAVSWACGEPAGQRLPAGVIRAVARRVEKLRDAEQAVDRRSA